MKLTKTKLKQIIQEELKGLNETMDPHQEEDLMREIITRHLGAAYAELAPRGVDVATFQWYAKMMINEFKGKTSEEYTEV